MANEQRAPRDYLSGTLSVAAAISDTTIQSTAFTGLPTNFTSTVYLPLVLHDPSAGLYEVAWCTAHSSSSTSVTVVRGREGTSARAWPTGTQVMCAPTVRDTLSVLSRASLPSDAHYGMRALVSDESVVNERSSAGWLPTVGVAAPAQVGPSLFNLSQFPLSSAVIQLRAGATTGTLDSNGQTTISYRTAFPTATIAVTPVSRFTGSEGPVVVLGGGASSFTCAVFVPSTGQRASNAAFTITYIAVGY